MNIETVIRIAVVAALVSGIAATVLGFVQTSWGRAVLGLLATVLALTVQLLAANTPAVGFTKQEPVIGCSFAKFPICAPFERRWIAYERLLGPAVTPVFSRNGFLTQCFERGCLGYAPNNPDPYRVQGTLLGEDLLKREGLARGRIELPPAASRWFAEQSAMGVDLLQLIGQPLLAPYNGVPGKECALYQMGLLCWPAAGTDDLAQVSLDDSLVKKVVFDAMQRPQNWWDEPWTRLALLLTSITFSAISLGKAVLDPLSGPA